MVLTLWCVRSGFAPEPDLEAEYEGPLAEFCTFKVHHNGKFSNLPRRQYVEGKVNYVDYVDMEVFSVHELVGMYEELGYDKKEPMMFYFLIPGTDIDYGLLPLGNDADVRVLAKYVGNHKQIDIYSEHGATNLATVFDPSIIPPTNEGSHSLSPEFNRQRPTRRGHGSSTRNIEKNLAMIPVVSQPEKNYVEVEDMGDDSDPFDGLDFGQEGEQTDYIAQSSKYKVRADDIDVVEGGLVDEEEEGFMDDEEGFMDDEVEGFNSDQEGFMPDVEEGGVEDNGDLLDDEDNVIDEPYVHMDKFVSVVDQDQQWITRDPHTIPIPDSLLNEDDAMEVIDTNVFDTTCDNSERREELLKAYRKPRVCSEGEVHTAPFKLGQKFRSKQDVKECVDLHSIQTNRALYYEKNDKVRIRVRCEGKVTDMNACGPWTKEKAKAKTKIINAPTTTCPWLLLVSRKNEEEDWTVKSLVKKHNCAVSRNIRACTAKFMAKNLVPQVESNPSNFNSCFLMVYSYGVFIWCIQVESRAHFSGRAKTDCLTNNLCEVFNSKIIDARDKPIITCLEYIREYLMKRIVVVQKKIDNLTRPLTPTATSILESITKEATQNVCIFNGLDRTQVTTPTKDQYVVNLNAKTCTCGYWELTGMVCSHVVSAIWDKVNHGAKNVPAIELWVHPIYWLSTWTEMYSHKVGPISGRALWPKSNCPTTLLAPKYHVPVGRPKKKRKRSVGEVVTTGKNLSRKFLTVTCSKCGNKGHNQRSCKGQGGEGQSSQVRKKPKQGGKKASVNKKAGKKQVGDLDKQKGKQGEKQGGKEGGKKAGWKK